MKYICTITEDGFSDLIVPIRSLQIRYRQSPKQCYLQVSIPDGLSYSAEIVERSDGEIRIDEIDDDLNEVELLTANVNTIRIDEGASNRSVTIIGYKQVTWPGTGTYTIPNVIYVSEDQTRALPVPLLRPLDTAIVRGTPSVVNEVTWTINSTGRQMVF